MRSWLTRTMLPAMGIACVGLCVSCTVEEKETGEQAAAVEAPQTEVTAPLTASEEPAPAEAAKSAWLKDYFGEELLKADGSKVGVDGLAGKTVGVYFSAHWCPPCRRFTPVLVKTYNELAAAGKPFEIVFVSSDRQADAMFNYMKETSMPWVALPFGSEHKRQLAGKYGVRGIPTLVILDKTGATVTKNGRGAVASKGVAAFDSW